MFIIVERIQSVNVEIFPENEEDNAEIIQLADIAAGELAPDIWLIEKEDIKYFDEDGEEIR